MRALTTKPHNMCLGGLS